jgi:hypothetical protein
MKIYDYEHFIRGRTNNLHFADTRHPFLITSRYTRLADRQAKTDHYRKTSLLQSLQPTLNPLQIKKLKFQFLIPKL